MGGQRHYEKVSKLPSLQISKWFALTGPFWQHRSFINWIKNQFHCIILINCSHLSKLEFKTRLSQPICALTPLKIKKRNAHDAQKSSMAHCREKRYILSSQCKLGRVWVCWFIKLWNLARSVKCCLRCTDKLNDQSFNSCVHRDIVWKS